MSGFGDPRRGPMRPERSRSPRRDAGQPYRDDRRAPGGRRDSELQLRGSQIEGNSRGRAAPVHGSHQETLLPLPKEVPIPESGRKLPEFAVRVAGTAGQRTRVRTNHFEVLSMPIVKIYQYDIRMKVPESSQLRGSDKVSAAQQAKVLVHEALISFWGTTFVYDGVSKGYSTTCFVPVGETRSTTINLSSAEGGRPNEVDLAIRNVGSLNIRTLVDYLMKGKVDLDPMGNPLIEPLLKWLNALYRQRPAARFTTRPNSNAYYERTPSTTMALRSTGDILEAIRGVFQTVQVRFGRITLNVDTATTAFWTPDKNLIEMIHALAGVPMQQNIEQWFLQEPDRFFHACGRLLGVFFCVRHLKPGQNARKTRLAKWSRLDSHKTVFEQKNRDSGTTREISVFDYFVETYGITLRYGGLPLADTRDGHIPLELCWSAGGERFKEPLQGAETADFIKFATAPANVRMQQITENVKKLGWHEQEVPKSHGLSVGMKMLELPARILPAPTPQYGRGTDRQPPAMGKWNLREKKLLKPATIKSWGLLYLPAGRMIDDRQLEQFAVCIARGFRDLGITTPEKLPVLLKGNPQVSMVELIKEIAAKTGNTFKAKPNLLFIVIHGVSERFYKAVKNTCEIQFGVASQVMLVEKALSPKGQMQYIANIGLKVNVKLGGINSTIREKLFEKPWMMLGGDTSHPSPAQLRMNPPPPTFSALSASYDRSCTAYSSVASAQFAKEQLISDFANMAKELLKRYQIKNHGQLPESILYYRDGLSEGEFSQIIANEAEPLKEVCASFGRQAPKITVVVVVKRHHTRLFPTERGDRNGNVLPGTVVENSGGHDIYLVAHPGLQGTVRPTRYAVLVDQNNLSADDFQRLTNNLCWSYARATTAVSVVPPVYYADQACERAKLHVREAPDGSQILGQVHEDLKFSMYWQ